MPKFQKSTALPPEVLFLAVKLSAPPSPDLSGNPHHYCVQAGGSQRLSIHMPTEAPHLGWPVTAVFTAVKLTQA